MIGVRVHSLVEGFPEGHSFRPAPGAHVHTELGTPPLAGCTFVTGSVLKAKV